MWYSPVPQSTRPAAEVPRRRPSGAGEPRPRRPSGCRRRPAAAAALPYFRPPPLARGPAPLRTLTRPDDSRAAAPPPGDAPPPPGAAPPPPGAEPLPRRGEAAREFEERLRRVAGSDVTVLIEGESGAGKDAAARRLHRLSPRAAGPLIEVDLAALSPTLMEAELFGHEEGAFTGAHRARRGRFRRAQGGTLVLSGVEALPESLQVKLLRALQERVVEPLGSEEVLPVDARVVATSARELAGLVRAGRFREDLYYRLAVVVLRVPPLRAHPEDLPGLVEALAGGIARRAGVAPRAFPPEVLERLARHPWPGNVRELENALERVLVLGRRRRARGGPEPVAVEELDFLDEAVQGEAGRLAREALAAGLTIDDLSLAMIEEALAESRGNLSAAARRVGLTRRALEYRRRRAAEGGDARGTADDGLEAGADVDESEGP